jgi:hypothetical protein
MKTSLFPLIVLFLSILTASCTKEVRYSKEALLEKAKAADPSVTFILPKTMNDGVRCTDYTEGCLSAHIVRVKELDLIAVEFMTEAEAVLAAKKFRGLYIRNWFLDDVKGEPVLEKFAKEKLEAKEP